MISQSERVISEATPRLWKARGITQSYLGPPGLALPHLEKRRWISGGARWRTEIAPPGPAALPATSCSLIINHKHWMSHRPHHISSRLCIVSCCLDKSFLPTKQMFMSMFRFKAFGRRHCPKWLTKHLERKKRILTVRNQALCILQQKVYNKIKYQITHDVT